MARERSSRAPAMRRRPEALTDCFPKAVFIGDGVLRLVFASPTSSMYEHFYCRLPAPFATPNRDSIMAFQ